MDQMDQKEYLFHRVRQLITHPQIREFTLKALEMAPEYIWEINASTSGRYHKGETQTEHVLQALYLAERLGVVLEHPLVKRFMPVEGASLLYAIVVLHDLFKCGLPGQERRRPDGSLATDPYHPLYPAEALKHIKVWDNLAITEIEVRECSWWSAFVEGVSGHSGPWSPEPFDFSHLRSLSNFTLLGFLCDYLSCQEGIQIDY